MSDWIDKQAEEIKLAEEEKQRRETFVKLSDYWSNIRHQIEKDVAKLNSHPRYIGLLKDNPLVVETESVGYLIRKDSFPNVVYINVVNGYEEVTVKVRTIKDVGRKVNQVQQVLKVVADGDIIYLTDGVNAYIVPEQASEYILTPIMEALNDNLKK